jgi:hypothetical protein
MGIITRNFANNVLSSGTLDATDGIDGVIPSSNIANASVTNITELPAAIEVIESVATDPVSPDEGEVWYNSTDNVLKVQSATTVGTWASGGTLSTTRYGRSAFGTQTSTLVSGGESNALAPPYGYTTDSEQYNGTAWTSGTALPQTNSRAVGVGIFTAGLVFGGGDETTPGAPGTTTLKYNGTSWTSTGNMTVSRYDAAGNGTNTAAIAFGGANSSPPFNIRTTAETFTSTAWTSITGLNTARLSLASSKDAPNSVALAFGGYAPGPAAASAATEEWNGTSWTNKNSMNTARSDLGGTGTVGSAIAFGGTPPSTGATEIWNGTSWSNNPSSMANARFRIASSGSSSSGLASGGYNGNAPTNNASLLTEEWTGPGVATTKTITVS